jgi:hypothetical protein
VQRACVEGYDGSRARDHAFFFIARICNILKTALTSRTSTV